MKSMANLSNTQLQTITTPTSIDCSHEFRSRRTLRSLLDYLLPFCCTFQQPHQDQNDTVSISSSTTSSSSSSDSSNNNNSIITGTFFGHRRGRVSFCLQDDTRVSSPLLLLELAVPTSALVKEMDRSGVLRIALKCDHRRQTQKGVDNFRTGTEPRSNETRSIFQVPVWSMCCNGRKVGYAVRRNVTENDAGLLKMMRSVSVGAGVLPVNGDGEEERLYLRAKFERVTGSSDSESFHMMNPSGSYGQELSIFLMRS